MKFCERLPSRTVYHVSLAEIVPPFDVRYHSTGTSSNNSSWLRVSDRDSGEINYRWDASARGRSNKTTLSNATFEPLPDKLHRRGIIGPGPKRWSIIQRSHFAAGTRDWPQNRRQIRIVDKRARVRPIRRLLVLLYSLSFSLPLWSLSLSPYIPELYRTNSVLIGTIPAACFPLEFLLSKYLIVCTVKDHAIRHSSRIAIYQFLLIFTLNFIRKRFSQLPRSNIYAYGLRIRNDIVSRNIPFRLVAYIYWQ